MAIALVMMIMVATVVVMEGLVGVVAVVVVVEGVVGAVVGVTVVEGLVCVVVALKETLRLMAGIDEVIPSWPTEQPHETSEV